MTIKMQQCFDIEEQEDRCFLPAKLAGKWIALEGWSEYPNAPTEHWITLVEISSRYPDRLHHYGGFSYMGWPRQFNILKIYDPADYPYEDMAGFDADALEIQYHNDFPPKKSDVQGSGWLSPDGIFYPCHSWEHDSIAHKVTSVLYRTLDGTRKLEREGWMRLSDGQNLNFHLDHPTQTQIDMLGDLLIHPTTQNNDDLLKNVERELRHCIWKRDHQE